MRTLREFLIAEARLHEGGDENKPKSPKPESSSKEVKVPPGFQKASVSGSMTRSGVVTIKQLGGEDAKYGQVKLSDVTVAHIRKKFGARSGAIQNLRDLVGTKGLFSSAPGAKIMQGLFRNMKPAAKVQKGTDGYIVGMIGDWKKIAGTDKSSQKVIMFWINALYNVYVKRDLEAVKLKFWFSGDSVLIMEP